MLEGKDKLHRPLTLHFILLTVRSWIFLKTFVYLAAPGHCAMQTLSCGLWDLAPWPRMEPSGPSALGARSLSHWTTREVLRSWILQLHYKVRVCVCVYSKWIYETSQIKWVCGFVKASLVKASFMFLPNEIYLYKLKLFSH